MRYVLISGELYRKGFSMPLLRCVDEDQKSRIMKDIHAGVRGSHIRGRALAVKYLELVYFGQP